MRLLPALVGLALVAAACSGAAPAPTTVPPVSSTAPATRTTVAPTTTPATATTTVASTTTAAPDPAAEVVAAAERTIAAASGRFRIVKATEVLGRGFTLSAEGAFEGPSRSLAVSVGGDLDFLGGDLTDEQLDAVASGPIFVMLTDDEFVYIDFAIDRPDSPAGRWVRTPVVEASVAAADAYGGVPFDLSLPVQLLWPSVITLTPALEATAIGPGEYEVGIDPHLLAADALSARAHAELVKAGLDDADLGSPIPVTVVVADGHVVRIAGDLTELFGRIARLPIAPAGMEAAAAINETRFEVEFSELGVPQEIEFPDPADVADLDPEVSVAEVTAGTCLPNGPEDLLPTIVTEVADCADPHLAEVYAVLEYPDAGGGYPGLAEVEAVSAAECYALAFDYLGGSLALVDVGTTEVWPTEQTWRLGDREVFCVFYTLEPLTRSLAGSLAGATEVSTYDLQPGDCLADESWFGQELVEPLADCGRPHRFEVISRHVVQGHVFPGGGAVTDLADDLCTADVDAVDPAAEFTVWYLTPNEGSWRFGDRGIICLAGSEEPVTGSLADQRIER